MAARTVLVTSAGTGVVKLLQDSSVTVPAAQAPDAANGNYLACGSATATQDPRIVTFLLTAGTTNGTLTIRATGNGVDTGGNVQVSPYPSNAVFTQGAVGDLNVVVLGTTTTFVGPLTTDRFLQPDGNIYLDWNGLAGATIRAIQFPFNVV